MTDARDHALIARRWDAEYQRGRYADEPPLRFIEDIVRVVGGDPVARDGLGLYVGCGNGRNYLPLVDADLRLCGLDLSLESLRQLGARRAKPPLSLVCAEFRAFHSARAFHYIIALQVFQHGTAADAASYFDHAAALVRPGGLLCVRVNSVATEIYHAHTVLERTAAGGLTIRYDAGPKTELAVHFYSRDELLALTRAGFEPLVDLREDVIPRTPPQTGSWAQWEGIWRRR